MVDGAFDEKTHRLFIGTRKPSANGLHEFSTGKEGWRPHPPLSAWTGLF